MIQCPEMARMKRRWWRVHRAEANGMTKHHRINFLNLFSFAFWKQIIPYSTQNLSYHNYINRFCCPDGFFWKFGNPILLIWNTKHFLVHLLYRCYYFSCACQTVQQQQRQQQRGERATGRDKVSRVCWFWYLFHSCCYIIIFLSWVVSNRLFVFVYVASFNSGEEASWSRFCGLPSSLVTFVLPVCIDLYRSCVSDICYFIVMRNFMHSIFLYYCAVTVELTTLCLFPVCFSVFSLFEVAKAPRVVGIEMRKAQDLARSQWNQRNCLGQFSTQHLQTLQGWSHYEEAVRCAFPGACDPS